MWCLSYRQSVRLQLSNGRRRRRPFDPCMLRVVAMTGTVRPLQRFESHGLLRLDSTTRKYNTIQYNACQYTIHVTKSRRTSFAIFGSLVPSISRSLRVHCHLSFLVVSLPVLSEGVPNSTRTSAIFVRCEHGDVALAGCVCTLCRRPS